MRLAHRAVPLPFRQVHISWSIVVPDILLIHLGLNISSWGIRLLTNIAGKACNTAQELGCTGVGSTRSSVGERGCEAMLVLDIISSEDDSSIPFSVSVSDSGFPALEDTDVKESTQVYLSPSAFRITYYLVVELGCSGALVTVSHNMGHFR